MMTFNKIITLAREARLLHEQRVHASEQKYKEDIRNLQRECPHETMDTKYYMDHNDCGYHVTYCVACGKEID